MPVVVMKPLQDLLDSLVLVVSLGSECIGMFLIHLPENEDLLESLEWFSMKSLVDLLDSLVPVASIAIRGYSYVIYIYDIYIYFFFDIYTYTYMKLYYVYIMFHDF